MIEFKLIYLPNSKKEALEKGMVFYFSGVKCKNGHYSERYARDGGCKQCRIERGKKWYSNISENEEFIRSRKQYNEKYREDNREQINLKRKEKYHEDPEKEKASHKKWTEKNREYLNNYMINWRLNNPDKQAINSKNSRERNKEKIAIAQSNYKKNNRDYFNKIGAERRALVLMAIPKWDRNNELASKLLSNLYSLAFAYKKQYKTDFHVDHIVPLIGKRRLSREGKMVHVVCGLHTPANLQILNGKDNLSKNCYKWPDM